MSEVRKIKYDDQLHIEAYQFQGIMQKFPNHFHEHYVIGFIEKGRRKLTCKNKDYEIIPGDLMLFEPGMNHTCDYLKLHYDQTLSLEQLSHECGMNKFVMLRNFAAEKGITPYQYLIATRINKAMHLLEANEDPLEVSLKTGFTDQSHFTNAFKRIIGLTPGQYKTIRGKKK